jgi:signal transduction histidine kinase
MNKTPDHYVEEIGQLMEEVDRLKVAKRRADHACAEQQKALAILETQNKTMQTLNLGLFGALELQQMYGLVCESLVFQVGWDSAFIVSLHINRLSVHASYGATEVQKGSVDDYLAANAEFIEAYSTNQTISTFDSHSPRMLAIRSIFHTDEVAAVPILFGDKLYGYIIVCSHTVRTSTRSLQDVNFVATIAAQVSHAIQKNVVFKDLETQNNKLKELDELKNSFISITSHQLRTPLSIVKWILSILDTDPALAALAEQRKLIGQAYSSNERLIHVVNDLLNISRIQDGRLPYSPQLTDISIILHDLCASTVKSCEISHVRVDCQVADNLPLVEVDPLLFKELLQNLIDNAIDYNVTDGWIKMSATVQDSKIHIAIANSGEGILPEDRGKIFNQFYRAPSAVKIHPNGNGLGLYLALAIAHQHGGDIMCESEQGVQTMFTLAIPTIHPA